MKARIYPSPRRIITPDRIRQAWFSSKDSNGKGGAPGIDRITAEIFSRKLEKNIQRISDEIRAGEFHFAPLRASPIPKSEAEYRIICVPTVRDRLVQRVLLHYLTAERDLFGVSNPSSFGVSKGRDQGTHSAIETAIRKRQQKPFVLKTDISKFFDNIPRHYLIQQIEGRLGIRSVVPLLEKVVACEIRCHDEDSKSKIASSGIVSGKGLRQGMPLSPLFSNLVLRRFDKKMAKLGKSYVRYVDDLAVFENSEIDAQKAMEIIIKELEQIGLSIPGLGATASKTEIILPDEGLSFLGLSIYRQKSGQYAKRIPDFAFDNIKDRLERDVSFEYFEGPDKAKSRNLSEYDSWFQSLAAGYSAAYSGATNLTHFIETLGALIAETRKKLLTQVLSEDVFAGLGEKEKRFLNLQ